MRIIALFARSILTTFMNTHPPSFSSSPCIPEDKRNFRKNWLITIEMANAPIV